LTCTLPLQTALLTNTLVCLPTGLGKTLIAAVVMHNFARWFPEVLGLRHDSSCGLACYSSFLSWSVPLCFCPRATSACLLGMQPAPSLCSFPFLQGKVVFVAPTKPLVAQQIDACHSFMGMSKSGFQELTGASAC
jgi:Fanconi anemia group M protein